MIVRITTLSITIKNYSTQHKTLSTMVFNMLSVANKHIMLNIVVLSAVMLNVIMLSVVAPCFGVVVMSVVSIGQWTKIWLKNGFNRIAHIRHQCRKTTILSCHICLINTGVEKMNNI